MSSDPSPKKPWGGRFREATDRFVERWQASIGFDRRLALHDIAGSIAHARMLGRQGIVPEAEVERIVAALEEIRGEIEAGTFPYSEALEDIHMNVEARLTEKVGAIGGKLHTARSRNDQVATDLRLWLRDEVVRLAHGIVALEKVLLDLAEAHAEVVFPGFTHLQTAQPVVFGHHCLAYVEMFERDHGRLADAYRRLNQLPLGAGALAGTTFPIDRLSVARELGFDGVCRNSLDAVSDRDFVIEVLAALSLLMVHLSRLAEELVLWSSPPFRLVRLPEGYCTGSSIMPQKRNPDVPELVRGKSGRVIGDLVSLLVVMKGLPLAYNKDMQEDKEPLFDAVDTAADCLAVMAGLMQGLSVDRERARELAGQGFATATDLADALVRAGLP
ncbi:MAG: argininosuccinate lyase, partial [Nitrospirae bacterium]